MKFDRDKTEDDNQQIKHKGSVIMDYKETARQVYEKIGAKRI